MADWFKFYENGLDESRLQWAINERPEVLPTWLLILTECCRHKLGSFSWVGEDYELFAYSKKINISVPLLNESLKLLTKIQYIEIKNGSLSVIKWDKMQSEYCQSKTRMQNQSGSNHHTYKGKDEILPRVSRECPESLGQEERRGEEIRREESVHALNGKFVKPTADEVKGRFRELEVPESEYEGFLAYYDSNGWKVGRNPMKDWKSACVNWKKNIRGRSKSKDSFI